MTQIKTLLQDIGLTNNQSTLYLYLAKNGSSKAGEIIKATGLHRNIVYSVLEELIDKRLIGSTKKNKILSYTIFDTSRIVAEQEDRVRKAKDIVATLAEYSKGNTPQQIIIYEGKEDFITQARRAYEIMSIGGTARTLGISPIWHELVGKEVGEELLQLQIEKKIKWKALAKELDKNDKAYMKSVGELMQAKVTPLVADDTSGIEILEDRISIRSFVEPYFIVEIVNTQLALNYQRYFDFLWERV